MLNFCVHYLVTRFATDAFSFFCGLQFKNPHLMRILLIIFFGSSEGENMIQKLLNEFRRADRDIDALTYVLMSLLVVLAGCVTFLVYKGQLDKLWSPLASSIPVIAALLVARVANRLIINDNIVREDKRRTDIVRTTHHLISITKDLKGRVEYVKKLLSEDSIPILPLSHIAPTIEGRYEALLDREAYNLLPGKCVDLIIKMSGSIFSISLLAAGAQQFIAVNPAFALQSLPNKASHLPPPNLTELIADIQKLIDELYLLRESLDAEGKRP
ncbi:hypothetical protein G9409_08290 [Chlorobium sp. BLA1]|uniref:hypothetical protein n=1 Tax=Candidatus Chlorobium masyuteum TaxID=2716876 RepID=UPI00141F61CC|nr:hypothetical protein [Candidatus Chlorobium masyuteum]NHQ60585.1 hypothetical protein [Candidatus Chlorobium masyuteum]